MTKSDFTTPEQVNEVYRRRARLYDWSVNAYYLIGFRWWAYRRRAIAALGLQPGATVVEIGCGTGLNFRLLQESIGLSGRLIGVDLSADMLEQARRRVTANGWSNVDLVHIRAADYDFPSSVDAVFSTFALSLEPRFDEVIAKAAMALVAGGRFVLLDLRMPDNWVRNLAPALVWLVYIAVGHRAKTRPVDNDRQQASRARQVNGGEAATVGKRSACGRRSR